MTIAYLTDVEGQWEKVATFCSDNPLIALDDDRIVLSDDTIFVFGGDAIDRGPHARRIVACLTDAKERYRDRVVLLAGNRDLNKLRLRRELCGSPHRRAPAEVHHDRVALLKWTLANTMGAGAAFEHRRTELGAVRDEDVVASFLADLENDGALTRYLRHCVLAWRHGHTLFAHGGVGDESLCTVPTSSGTSREVADIDAWIRELGDWYAAQLDAYAANTIDADGTPGWQPIIAYQQPAPGKRGNPRSVVYSCLADEDNDPHLPPHDVIERMTRSGIRRLVAGHTPSGDTPSILRDPSRGFELVIADSNYARVASGSHVAIDDDAISIAGEAVLDDGERRVISFVLGLDERSPIGLRAGGGPLIKAPLGEGEVLTMRYLPRYQLEQRARSTADLDPLIAPYPR